MDTVGEERAVDDDGGHAGEEGPQFDPNKLTEFLSSAYWSAFIHIVLLVNKLPKDLASWAEGCPCHEPLIKKLSAHRRGQMFEDRGFQFCPDF